MITYSAFKAWYPSLREDISVIESSDFSLESGKITAITGLNGSGKTTLIKTILGLNPYGSGTLSIKGKKQQSLLLPKWFDVGYAPEMNSENEDKSYRQIFNLVHDLHAGQKKEGEILYSTDQLISLFKLEPYDGLPFKKLSKGTKKRVQIVASIIGNPEVLILDEPFEGLDQDQRKRLKNLLIEFKKDRYLLISSHELMELDTFCDHYLLVKENHVIQVSYDQIHM